MRSHPHRARYLALGTTALLAAALIAGCSSGGGSKPSSSGPIIIGTSLSLTGDFSTDGIAFEKGYELWVHDINAHGGIMGRKVQLDILNDNSSQTQVVTNYTDLINVKHVDLTFGPFSSLLTAPAAEVAHRYNFAFIEGAGGSPLVFGEKLPDVFDVALPVANELDPFVNWIKSLPASQRPTTAAYPMANDPFATPQVQLAQSELQPLGIKTLYSKIFPEEEPDYLPNADIVAGKKPQAVILGSVDVPTVAAFMKGFEEQHYNPKVFVAAAGPDQGSAFESAVGGPGNANGMMVPDAWYPGYPSATSQAMVNEYVAKYGGTASGVNADVAEAYSVGEVTAQAVEATHSLSGPKLIAYLHSGVTLTSVEGPVSFNSIGENVKAIAFIFQWQNGKFVQVLPTTATGSVPILYPKTNWSS
ncbi:MAG TPA: amino acid ABC transporter substrate-binding protein [Streptosporangiaceae bacterium]|jgi:branched-chain amino acid transport system substrate-binding protein|nr:amino acid ABC transporter substrate-binding protein [Streptosporangiaceae bacterium]